jgi:ABC-type spermidine/putrescine transport system permease subunit I
MVRNTLLCGLMLVLLGGFAYMDAPPKDDGSKPMTALIPAFVGLPLMLCGMLVAAKPNLRKHVMHFAALIGLLGAAGGFMPMYRQMVKDGKPFDITAPSVRTGVMMTAICLLFVGLCVNSFIEARKARQAAVS